MGEGGMKGGRDRGREGVRKGEREMAEGTGTIKDTHPSFEVR